MLEKKKKRKKQISKSSFSIKIRRGASKRAHEIGKKFQPSPSRKVIKKTKKKEKYHGLYVELSISYPMNYVH